MTNRFEPSVCDGRSAISKEAAAGPLIAIEAARSGAAPHRVFRFQPTNSFVKLVADGVKAILGAPSSAGTPSAFF
jgi:hypothetical protein